MREQTAAAPPKVSQAHVWFGVDGTAGVFQIGHRQRARAVLRARPSLPAPQRWRHTCVTVKQVEKLRQLPTSFGPHMRPLSASCLLCAVTCSIRSPASQLSVHTCRRRELGAHVALALASSHLIAPPKSAHALSYDGSLPAAATLLRAAEVTAVQEDLLRRSAAATEQQRFDDGLLVGRQDMIMSVEILIRNAKLERVPNTGAAVAALQGVKRIAEVGGTGLLGQPELLAMARQYAAAREELRAAFERMPERERERGLQVVRRLRAEDEARLRAGDEAAPR